jgi:hypothetical protein
MFANPGQRIRQRIRSDQVGFNQPTKSERIPRCGPTFGSLVMESDGILRSEFDGTLVLGLDRPLLLISYFN